MPSTRFSSVPGAWFALPLDSAVGSRIYPQLAPCLCLRPISLTHGTLRWDMGFALNSLLVCARTQFCSPVRLCARFNLKLASRRQPRPLSLYRETLRCLLGFACNLLLNCAQGVFRRPMGVCSGFWELPSTCFLPAPVACFALLRDSAVGSKVCPQLASRLRPPPISNGTLRWVPGCASSCFFSSPITECALS